MSINAFPKVEDQLPKINRGRFQELIVLGAPKLGTEDALEYPTDTLPAFPVGAVESETMRASRAATQLTEFQSPVAEVASRASKKNLSVCPVVTIETKIHPKTKEVSPPGKNEEAVLKRPKETLPACPIGPTENKAFKEFRKRQLKKGPAEKIEYIPFTKTSPAPKAKSTLSPKELAELEATEIWENRPVTRRTVEPVPEKHKLHSQIFAALVGESPESKRSYPQMLPALKIFNQEGGGKPSFVNFSLEESYLFYKKLYRWKTNEKLQPNDRISISLEDGSVIWVVNKSITDYVMLMGRIERKFGLDKFYMERPLPLDEWIRKKVALAIKNKDPEDRVGEMVKFDGVFSHKRLKRHKGRYYYVDCDQIQEKDPTEWKKSSEIRSFDGKRLWELLEAAKNENIVHGDTQDRIIDRRKAFGSFWAEEVKKGGLSKEEIKKLTIWGE